MRLILIVVLAVVSFDLSAQEGIASLNHASSSHSYMNGKTNAHMRVKKRRSKSKPSPPKPCMNDFYASQCLFPDSACSPYLYYQVYDWLGTRYQYSGNSKKGIDCSGFVSEMYKNTYCIELNGSSGSIYNQVEPVEKEKLREGDLLFFKIRRNQISHVGVYLGNNKFAHASVHSGVIISDLNEQYYKKYFYKGGRFQLESASLTNNR
jgi:lipoprotein Spr